MPHETHQYTVCVCAVHSASVCRGSKCTPYCVLMTIHCVTSLLDCLQQQTDRFHCAETFLISSGTSVNLRIASHNTSILLLTCRRQCLSVCLCVFFLRQFAVNIGAVWTHKIYVLFACSKEMVLLMRLMKFCQQCC